MFDCVATCEKRPSRASAGGSLPEGMEPIRRFGHASEGLVGREPQLQPVEHWLRQPRGSAVILLHGEHGIGRTSVWRRAMDMAVAGGCRVLTSRPAEAEAGMHFAALGDLLWAVSDEELSAMPAPQREVLQALLLQGRGKDRTADVREVSLALLRLLQLIAAQRSVALGIDDVQWLDGATAGVLNYVVRRLEASPVLVVGTFDTGVFGSDAGEPVLRFEGVEERLEEVPVPPLTDDGVSLLLRRRNLEGWTRSLIREAVRTAAGNPRIALELTVDADGGSPSLVPPKWIMRWVHARLARLSEAARETLDATAHLREPTEPLLECWRGASVADHLREGGRAGLVEVAGGRVRFTRPVIGAVLRASVGPERRRAIHGELAAALPDCVERWRQQALVAQDPDETLASALEQASIEAGSEGDAELAGILAELSLRLTRQTKTAEAVRRRLFLAKWRLRLGDDLVAAELFSGVAETPLPAGAPRARTMRRLAWLELHIRGTGASQRRLAECRAAVDGDDALAAELEADLLFLHYLRGDLAGARAHGAGAVEQARRRSLSQRSRWLVAAADAAEGAAPWTRMPSLDDLDNASDLPASECTSIALAVRHALAGDDLTRISPVLARRAATAGGGAMWLGWRAEAECWRECWGEATALAEHGTQLAWETGEWVAMARLLYVEALIASNRGRLEEARTASEEGDEVARRAGLPTLSAANRAVRGYVEMMAGSGPACSSAFESILATPIPGTEPGLLRLLPTAVEALLEAGSVDHAHALLARLDVCRTAMPVRWLAADCARCHGIAAAGLGRLQEADELLNEAVEIERVSPRRLELGRHLLALGVVRRRRRRRDQAAEAFGEAQELFTGLGAEAWRRRAEAEIGRLRASHSGHREELSITQQRVADLVAQGKSNKEVARALSLSVYTVESNLKAIYRKLGVRSRAALGFRLLDDRR